MAGSPKKAKSGHASGAGKRASLWIAGLVLVGIAVVVVVLVSRTDDSSADGAGAAGTDQPSVSETNSVVIDGASLPRFDEGEVAFGQMAPQASGLGFDGEAVTLLEAGKPTVIGFFAHWCPHCQAEVDELSKHLAATGLPQDVNVIAVSTRVDASDGNYPPSAWFESEGWPAPVLTDDESSSIAISYGLTAFPFWAIVDAEGRVVQRSAGGIGPNQFDEFVELARASS